MGNNRISMVGRMKALTSLEQIIYAAAYATMRVTHGYSAAYAIGQAEKAVADHRDAQARRSRRSRGKRKR